MNTQSISPQASVAATLPPVACAAWCEYNDGHTNAFMPEDQWCASEQYDVQGRCHPSGKPTPATVRVYAHRGAGERVPLIHIGEGESAGVYVDATSARMLAAALVALADRIER